MAKEEVGSAAVSSGSIPAHSDIQTLDKQVSPQFQMPVPGFASEFAHHALTPTAMSELASSVTSYAANAYAERAGRELGKNPEGELLPPLTRSDKSFVESYSQQARVSLGLQAQQLLNKSKEEIDSANSLSPELITKFGTSTLQGLDGILKHAPSTIRPQMEYQYLGELQSSIHNMNERMISQQKELSASQATAWRNEQAIKMNEAARDGAVGPDGTPLAKTIYDTITKNIEASLADHTITPVQAQTALAASKLNYYTALETKKAYDAKERGGEELYKYLSDISDKKIPGLNWSESESVRNNVVSNIGAVENADNRYQTLLGAEATNEIQNGTFTSDRQAYYKSVMRPEKFLNLMTRYTAHIASAKSTDSKVSYLVKNASNSSAYAGMKPETINDTFDILTKSAMQHAADRGEPITPEEAEFRTASYMAVPAPKFIDKMHLQLSSTSPSQILTGYENYSRLHALDGFKTIGVKPQDIAKGEIFKSLLAQETDPQAAAERAQEIVYSKPEEVIRDNERKITQYFQDKGVKPDGLVDWATKTAGTQPGIKFDNSAAFGADIQQVFAGYMQLTNGDTDTSQKLTQQYANKVYDVSKVDGDSKIAYLPIEKTLGMQEGGTPLIQEDIIMQAEKQFEVSRKNYDAGNAPFYWRVVPRYNYNHYMEAKTAIKNKGSSDPEYARHHEVIRQYESGKPIEIEQVFRGKEGEAKRYQLSVNTPYTASVSPQTGKVQGGYNLTIKDPETGLQHAMYGYYGQQRYLPTYSPNEAWLNERYINVIPSQGLWQRAKELPFKAGKALLDSVFPEAN